MRTLRHLSASARACIVALAMFACGRLAAQGSVKAEVMFPAESKHKVQQRASLFWLEPLTPELAQRVAWIQGTPYRLLQKNKTFSPHFLVVPVGATVVFPNGDPFFHNVFSLFDGKRFDLGLYEAGRSRDVRFERAGISYIFCNIHPEMGAVVITLKSSLWSTQAPGGQFQITNVPEGLYEAHLWVEGEDEQTLTRWTHRITLRNQDVLDAGTFQAKPERNANHLDKFGRSYKSTPEEY